MFILVEKDSKTSGRWTDSEHQKFVEGLELYGKNWKKIEELIGTRTGAQIRSHAQKFFLKPTKIVGNDQSEVVLEDQEEEEPFITVTEKLETPVSTDYSYFMERIIAATSQNKDINFWNEFMDVKSEILEIEVESKRKDSVCLNDICNESKMESTVPYQLLENDGV